MTHQGQIALFAGTARGIGRACADHERSPATPAEARAIVGLRAVQ